MFHMSYDQWVDNNDYESLHWIKHFNFISAVSDVCPALVFACIMND